jgi:PAS domain S-box-containing protein
MEEPKALFPSLFYNSPIGITISDVATSRFIMVNNSFLKIFGFEEKEVIGKKATDLNLIREQIIREENIGEIKKNGRIQEKEILAYKKNGEPIYCLTSIEYIEIENKMASVSTFQDITERRNIETQLTEAKREAEKATLSKNTFLANMSHEIRTPLNAMLGFADLLEATQLNELQKEYLDAIEVSGKNLLTIINDILDFSKIEAGMLSIEQVSFGPQQLIQSVYTMFFKKAQSKNLKLFISLDPKLPPLLSGDPIRLNQIMINLIGNAVKFTAKGSVSVDCEVMERINNKVKLRFSVKDTGIGIPREKLATVFDRFTQAENNTTRNFGGTGLGLSIAKRLIELQGGEIFVNSKPGKGSEFYFTVEYMIADGKEYTLVLHNRKKTEGVFKGKKALVVEDNPLNQKLVLTLLKNEGFDAEVAENGQIAVDLLKEKTYGIILMDLQMPVLDGYEATRKIRREVKSTIPIIAMTANAMAGEQERCMDTGMDDYITKPFKAASLLNILFKFLNTGKDVSPENTKQTGLPGEKITDLSYLKEFSGGKDSFVKDMLEVFLEQNPIDVEFMEKAIANDNFDGMKALAHSLQTSLGFIGFSESHINCLKESEILATEKRNLATIKTNLEIIVAACRKAQQELKEELKKLE